MPFIPIKVTNRVHWLACVRNLQKIRACTQRWFLYKIWHAVASMDLSMDNRRVGYFFICLDWWNSVKSGCFARRCHDRLFSGTGLVHQRRVEGTCRWPLDGFKNLTRHRAGVVSMGCQHFIFCSATCRYRADGLRRWLADGFEICTTSRRRRPLRGYRPRCACVVLTHLQSS